MRRRGSVKDSILTQPPTPWTPTILPTVNSRSADTSASSGCLGLLAGFLHQPAHLVGQLRALGDPRVDLLGVELQAHFLAGGDRVVETQTLDVAAVARLALVGHDDVIERTAFGAAAGKTNLDHVYLPLNLSGTLCPQSRMRTHRPQGTGELRFGSRAS